MPANSSETMRGYIKYMGKYKMRKNCIFFKKHFHGPNITQNTIQIFLVKYIFIFIFVRVFQQAIIIFLRGHSK